MGSCLSGRHGRRSDARFADDLFCLNLADWRKRGWLQPNAAGFGQCDVRSASGRVRTGHAQWDLEEREGRGHLRLWSTCEITMDLSTSAQSLGGVRWWMVCPRCRERCGRLYCDIGEWGCRSCLHLRYRSQHLGRAQRARSRAEKYFERAGTFHWVADPPRPKGMHRTTHGRLLSHAREYQRKWVQLGVIPIDQDIRRFRVSTPE